jgi:aqualysin 1
MKKRALLVVASVLYCAVAWADGTVHQAAEKVPNQYIVVLKDDAVPRGAVVTTATEMALGARGRVLGVMHNGIRAFGLEVSPSGAEALTRDHRVAWVEENAIGHLSYQVEYYSDDSHWHLDRLDQRTPIPQWNLKAYAWTSTGYGVAVYLVDTGVQAAHTEFSNGNVTAGANYALGDGYLPTNPCGGFGDFYLGGHGTATASLVGGRTVGVARAATIIPVKVATCHPGQNPEITLTSLSAIQSLDWVLADINANPGRRAVVSMSIWFDSGVTDCGLSDCLGALDNNLRNVINAGAVVVASANNQHANHCVDQSPARMGYGGIYDDGSHPEWPFVITAGGTNISDGQYFCQYCLDHNASDIGSNFGPCVDIYAPAQVIRAAHVAAAGAYRDEQVWLTEAQQHYPLVYRADLTVEWVSSGTSFAAPIVAGAAARLLQTFPTMTVRQVWDTLKTSATSLPGNFDGDGVSANDILIYVSPYN